MALRLGDAARAEATFSACADPLEKKQLAYLLARHGTPFLAEEEGGQGEAGGEGGEKAAALREELRAIMSNSLLSEHYLALARDLDVLEPKVPEDVYKSHLAGGGEAGGGRGGGAAGGAAAADSARANLAATLVNGFLNAGFGADKLVTPAAAGGGGGEAGAEGAAGGADTGELPFSFQREARRLFSFCPSPSPHLGVARSCPAPRCQLTPLLFPQPPQHKNALHPPPAPPPPPLDDDAKQTTQNKRRENETTKQQKSRPPPPTHAHDSPLGVQEQGPRQGGRRRLARAGVPVGRRGGVGGP